MFRAIEDFRKSWQYESEATAKVFDYLTQDSLDKRVTDDGRSLRDLAWHITQTVTEMPGQAGYAVEGARHEQPAPESLKEIQEAYRSAARSCSDVLGSQLSDEKLTETLSMYGQDGWTYGGLLTALISHQAHHRGQMTVLMRQAGLVVPGVYGPAKEEWAAMGLEAQP